MPRVPGSSAAHALLALALTLAAAPAGADVRVVATDARGVTLEVTVGAWSLSPPDPDGRVRIVGTSGSSGMVFPGRALLPGWAATLALPPDGRPTARVIGSSGEQSRGNARIVIAGKPVFRGDINDRLGPVPGIEPVPPIADGPWPTTSVEMQAPFGFRGRRLVQLQIWPFRYDEAEARVWSPLTVTVRVDWNRTAGALSRSALAAGRDRHVDAALETSVLNWEQASGWRVAPAPLVDARERMGERRAGPRGAAGVMAFEENDPEVRVRLDETGLYRIPFDELAPKGYPAAVPVSDVSVHRHEYLEGAFPPYGTFEMPCEVEDYNQNDVFDSGDAVWLYAQSWAERSNATTIRRYWGDAEVVFVTRKAGGGLRVAHRPGWNNVPGLTPPASYPFKKHHHRDGAPIMGFVTTPSDTNIGIWQWTAFAAYYNRPDTMRIAAFGLDNTRDATLTARWVGRSSNFHILWAAVKNGANQVTTVIDSVFWFGKVAQTYTATFPGTSLTDGDNNFLRQWGKSQFAPPHPLTNSNAAAGLDWFDLDYWRRYVAHQDYLQFNSSDVTGDVQLSVGGFRSDSLRVYDITDPSQPVRVVIDPAHHFTGPTVTIEFQDVVGGARREYVAAAIQDPPFPAAGPKAPRSSAYSSVTRRSLWSSIEGDYLLVVPEAFAGTVGPLADLRRSQGISVIEAPLESVYDEFGDGRHSSAAIERFAKYAYQRWDSRFLMLVGDGTLDPNHVRPFSGQDWIPIVPSVGPVGAGEGYEIIPSDNRFAFITGPSNPIFPSDSAPVVPEMMVGRLTVNSVAEASTVIGKIVAYENVQPTDDWRRNVLLTTDDAFSSQTTFGGPGPVNEDYCWKFYEEYFVDINDIMQGLIESDSGVAGMNVEQYNLRSCLTNEDTCERPNEPCPGDTCRRSRDETRTNCHMKCTPELLSKLSAGQLMWNYQGHANENLLTHEDLYLNFGNSSGDDGNRLVNNNKPFFLAAFSCHVNMFARDTQLNSAVGPSIGEDLLGLSGGRGAVASWASVCFEVVPGNPAFASHLNIELIRTLFVNPPRDETLGPEDRGSRVILGEVILGTMLTAIGKTTQQSEKGIGVSYTLLGDPATRLSIGKPISTMFANSTPVTSGVKVRLHTPGDTLRLEAKVVTNVRIDSLALFENSGGGDVLVPPASYTVSPAFPDTGQGNLYGGRRFTLTYRTRPAPQSVTYTFVATDRNGLVQTTDAEFALEGQLRRDGDLIGENEEVAPTANLSMELLSPAPVFNPTSDITLTVNGVVQPFSATQTAGDNSSREWILSWEHLPYPIDNYVVEATIQGGGSVTRLFRVTATSGQLAFRDLIAFPNPFDTEGTRFSFVLLGGEGADVKVHVFSQAGKSLYTQAFRGLNPGYHQLAWDGKDAEGDELANGVYFYRLSATTVSGTTTQQLGRLVKLRKPRRSEESAAP